MKKNDYFRDALELGLYTKKDWVITLLAVTEDTPEDRYEYQVVRQGGLAYINTLPDNKLVKLDDVAKDEPLFKLNDPITVTRDIVPNLNADKLDTTIGRVLFNMIVIYNSFNKKIPFMNEKVKVGKLDSIIGKSMNNESDPNRITVQEYQSFVNALYYMTNFSNVSVVAITERLITPPPGIDKLKKELQKKYTDLGDPVQLANYEQELIDFDAKYLKGDPGAENFQNDGKSRNIIRKKLFLSLGSEKGLVNDRVRNPVLTSLYEGWDVKDLPEIINSLRAGAYSRGANTQLGGEMVKWLFRASTGLEIAEEDCHSKVGKPLLVTDSNYKSIVGHYIIVNDKPVLINEDSMASKLNGKVVKVRSPLFCHTPDNNFCKVCLGVATSRNKDGLSIAISEIGSLFLLLKMKAMHGKALSTAKLDLNLNLS